MELQIQHFNSRIIYGVSERPESMDSSDLIKFVKLGEDLKEALKTLPIQFKDGQQTDHQMHENKMGGPKYYGGRQEIYNTTRTVLLSTNSTQVFIDFLHKISGLMLNFIKEKGGTAIHLNCLQLQLIIDDQKQWIDGLFEVEKIISL